MPRRSLFTRNQIVRGAVNLVRRSGIDALTARQLAHQMGCTTSPLFTLFEGMEELKEEVDKSVKKMFEDYIVDALNYDDPFREYGLRLVAFGKNEPQLFKYMFLSSASMVEFARSVEDRFCGVLSEKYGVDRVDMQRMMDQTHVFAAGMAFSLAHGARFTASEVNDMLSRVFLGSMMIIRQGVELPQGLPELVEGAPASKPHDFSGVPHLPRKRGRKPKAHHPEPTRFDFNE